MASATTKKLNPHLEFGPTNIIRMHMAVEQMGRDRKSETPTKRIKQRTQALLNKLEREWFDKMYQEVLRGDARHLRAQAIRFRLANGVYYTPDITCTWCGQFSCFEVKGPHIWDDAIVKLKVAAREYPEIYWHLVGKRDGEWETQLVLP